MEHKNNYYKIEAGNDTISVKVNPNDDVSNEWEKFKNEWETFKDIVKVEVEKFSDKLSKYGEFHPTPEKAGPEERGEALEKGTDQKGPDQKQGTDQKGPDQKKAIIPNPPEKIDFGGQRKVTKKRKIKRNKITKKRIIKTKKTRRKQK